MKEVPAKESDQSMWKCILSIYKCIPNIIIITKKDKSDNAFFFEIHEQLKTGSNAFAISS